MQASTKKKATVTLLVIACSILSLGLGENGNGRSNIPLIIIGGIIIYELLDIKDRIKKL